VALAHLPAGGTTTLFAAANGTPMFRAVFVFTLQGDLQLLLALLLASAVSEALAAPLRGEGWNEHQLGFLIRRSRVFTKECGGSSSSSLLPTASQATLPMASLAASSVQIIFESLVDSSLPRGIKSTQALPS